MKTISHISFVQINQIVSTVTVEDRVVVEGAVIQAGWSLTLCEACQGEPRLGKLVPQTAEMYG